MWESQSYLHRRALGANQANVVGPGWFFERDVLPDQDSDADAAQVEAIEELVNLGHLSQQRLRVHIRL